MERKFLEDMGLEKESVDKILNAHSADIGAQIKLAAKAESERDAAIEARDDLQSQLDGLQQQLQAFEGVDVAELQGKLTALTDDMQRAQQTHAEELQRIQRRSDTKDFFAALPTQFANEETREHYMAKLESALDDPQNRGKSRQEILDTLTAGADGKPRPGIYKEPENPNRLDIPPAGDIEDKPKPKAQPRMFF